MSNTIWLSKSMKKKKKETKVKKPYFLKVEIPKGDCHVELASGKTFHIWNSSHFLTYKKGYVHILIIQFTTFSVSPPSLSKISYFQKPNVMHTHEIGKGKDTCIDNLRLTIFFLKNWYVKSMCYASWPVWKCQGFNWQLWIAAPANSSGLAPVVWQHSYFML